MASTSTSTPTSYAGRLRARRKACSNNARNPNQNVCVQQVAAYFGTSDDVRYLHTMSDLVTCVRKRYTVRSRMSAFGSSVRSVGALRKKAAKVAAAAVSDTGAKVNVVGFIVGVPGHVLMMDASGNTVVDTAPRKRDRRAVDGVYIVYRARH